MDIAAVANVLLITNMYLRSINVSNYAYLHACEKMYDQLLPNRVLCMRSAILSHKRGNA